MASGDRSHEKSWLVAASLSRPHGGVAAEGFGVTFHLTIGNKAYSSWSLRPWILLTHFGIPFEETVIPLDQPETRAAIT